MVSLVLFAFLINKNQKTMSCTETLYSTVTVINFSKLFVEIAVQLKISIAH